MLEGLIPYLEVISLMVLGGGLHSILWRHKIKKSLDDSHKSIDGHHAKAKDELLQIKAEIDETLEIYRETMAQGADEQTHLKVKYTPSGVLLAMGEEKIIVTPADAETLAVELMRCGYRLDPNICSGVHRLDGVNDEGK